MPRKRPPSPQRFDTDLLDPEALTTRVGLQTALRSVERVCNHNDASIELAIAELRGRPNVFEYIMSTFDNQQFERLSNWIIARFPDHDEPNVMESLSIKLLEQLSSSMMPVERALPAEQRNRLRELRRKMGLTLDVLTQLDGCVDQASVGANVLQTGRKKPKASARKLRLDPDPFYCAGIPVPTTEHEVQTAYGDIFLRLKGTLGDFLQFLRRPMISDLFKRQLEELGITAVESTTKPIRASLHFDNVEGFGEWRILLSTKAQKYLREVRNNAIFEVVMERMKELSQGYFFGDNQTQITSPKTIIPVYEAKLTDETRLVYRIDCIPEGEVETQAISVFGIYTPQIGHRRFWDTLSQQLGNRGPDYVERYMLEGGPLNTGDGFIFPVSFPRLRIKEFQERVPLVGVCEEDLKKIHSMLVLERFVVMSQALLNSILADQDIPHVFVVSAHEQEIIESTSSCYVIGRSGTGKTTTMLFKMLGIERAWKQSPGMVEKPRQIFVTQSRVLATKVEEYFSKLMLSVKAASSSPEELRKMSKNIGMEMEFIDLDDIAHWRSDLPVKFSQLTDEHFPLFITYERLCLMVQNDIGKENDNDGFIIPVPPIMQGPGRDRFISYLSFLSRYWNRFPQRITRALDPALVFGEILGVIKGSEHAVGTPQRCLDRDAYVSDSRRGMFPHTKDNVYELFTEYTKLKRERQEYDAADRTHYILKEMRDAGWREKDKGKKVDFLYIDEVQDNLLIDTLVLRTICKNPLGLFWAGDTAQTISIGSSFKFSDLKAFQYRLENKLHHGRKQVDPETHELAINYRSHGGIVNCARSVVELIMLYWSHSIDILDPERASVDGFRPIFFSSQGNCDLERSFFGDGKGEPVEFGADQCILVRDNAARKRLKERLGDRSIIMTLYESKGLEFNDVLLYNFFEDSTANDGQWRVVVKGSSDGPAAPGFDETRHASICTELKFLYVAITRARRNLWFLDNSERAEPMKAYWKDKNQIEVWESTSQVPRLATESTKQDWIDTGKLMFTSKHYAQAKVAFQRAGRSREVAICHAFLLREIARAVPDDQVGKRADDFSSAGEAFRTCASRSLPGQKRERLAYFTNAAECFVQGDMWEAAGDCFLQVEQYSKAACAYREDGCFDKMVNVLERHGDQIEPGLLAQLTKVAQLNYFKEGKVKKAQKLFSSKEEAIAFAEDYGFDDAHVELLHTAGMIFESAEALINSGRIADAVKALIFSPRAQDRTRRAVEYLTTGLWQYQSFGVDNPTTDTEAVSELLELAKTLRDDMHEQEVNEIAMFRARHEGDFKTLHFLHPRFTQAENYPAALLCLDPTFISTLPLQNTTAVDHGPELLLHFAYFELLDRLRREDRLHPGSMRQKVFAFQSRGDDRFFIPANSFLHAGFSSRPETGQEQGGCVVTHEELRRVLDRVVPEYIHLRAKQQNNAYRRRLGSYPCMTMVTRGECSREGCQFQHEKMTVTWFNARIRSVLMEIRILNLTGFHPKGVIIHWIGVLYSILHPPSPKLGSIAILDLGSSSESVDGIRILREWIWQACDKLLFSTSISPFQYNETFLPDFMPVCTMAYDFDYERAQAYVPRTRMYRWEKWPQRLIRPGLSTKGHFIVRDFVQLLQGGPHHSLILGVLYLRQILVNRIPVDLGPFCDAVERLCGLHILAHRFATERGTLHGITLPRSWFMSLLRSRPNLDKDRSHIPHFVHDTIELLRRVDLQREQHNSQDADSHQFKHNGSRLGPLNASMYIVRICFCLCLLGYNINDNALRLKVLQGIHRLRRPGERVNGAHRPYAEAPDWWGLVKVFTRSLSDSALDEMVLLLHSKAPKYQGWVSRYVRTVMYDKLEEIPDRLRSKAAGRSGGRPIEPENDDGLQKQLALPEEDVLNPTDGEANIGNGGQDEASASPEEIQAALVIAAAYHRFSKRKKEVLKGINATRARLWSLLHTRASFMEWSRYKLLMQGPLVHVLVCLDGVKMFADYINKDSKKRLQGGGHKKLEELIERSDRSSDLQRTAAELRTKLGHSSPFHDNRSAPALQAAVLEVGGLIDRLSEFPGDAATKTKEEIEDDWKLGWDGIVREPVMVQKI